MAERNIRALLKKRVEAYGGEIRAMSWIGHDSAPDVLALFPAYSRFSMRQCRDIWDGPKDIPEGAHLMIETKAPRGEPTEKQAREHVRLRSAGCVVLVISTKSQLDAWLPEL